MLPWWQLGGLLRNLPPDSNIAVELAGPHWSIEAHMLDELRMTFLAVMGADQRDLKSHPDRPKAIKATDPMREKRLALARGRVRERARKIAAGVIP